MQTLIKWFPPPPPPPPPQCSIAYLTNQTKRRTKKKKIVIKLKIAWKTRDQDGHRINSSTRLQSMSVTVCFCDSFCVGHEAEQLHNFVILLTVYSVAKHSFLILWNGEGRKRECLATCCWSKQWIIHQIMLNWAVSLSRNNWECECFILS